jgi:alpha-tubulin suppressor-like RCC1 family protein
MLVAGCGRISFDPVSGSDDATPDDAALDDAPDAAPGPCARLTAGRNHICVYQVGGELRCWGDNTVGQLGIPATPSGRFLAAPIPGLGPVTAAAAGRYSTCAARIDSTVACLGENGSGQLGDVSMTSSDVPVNTVGLTQVSEVASGALHACAIAGGALWCWGDGSSGRLGTGNQLSHSTPFAVSGGQIAAPGKLTVGGSHSCVIAGTGEAWCWGLNGNGQLGIGTQALTLSPVNVMMLGVVTDVRVRDESSCAVKTGGQAVCFGNGDEGQLGNGGTADSSLPVDVIGVTDAEEVGVGIPFACARTTTGGVTCWGTDLGGQLGDGVPGGVRATAAPVIGLPPVTQLVVAAYSSCAMTADGDVWCWGLNDQGQLGIALGTAFSATPVFAFDACP